MVDELIHLVAENLHQEYPNKIAHHLDGPEDVRSPAALTPCFFGCYDWHSAVHSHWALAVLMRQNASSAASARGAEAMAQSLTPEKVAAELRYLEARPSFEMPYGIAWLLQLCQAFPDPALAPLEQLGAERFCAWLENLPRPIRSGEHSSSAFAMGLALDYARSRSHHRLAEVLERQARAFYLADRDAPLDYEPSAYDFLSPTLAEADLMRRVLPAEEFASWRAAFLPELRYQPVRPASRSDGKLVHFDGLNLSRAWMLWHLDRALAEQHGEAGMRWLDGATYMGTHWLPTFTVYWMLRSGRFPALDG